MIRIGANLPSSADWAIGLLVGIDFLFYGFGALAAASALKHGEVPLAGEDGGGRFRPTGPATA